MICISDGTHLIYATSPYMELEDGRMVNWEAGVLVQWKDMEGDRMQNQMHSKERQTNRNANVGCVSDMQHKI